MKLNSLNSLNKSTSKKQPKPNQLKDMLSKLLNVVEDFEKNGKVDCKEHKDRIDILKSFITDFIKDEEQKTTIMGEKITEERPFVSKFKMI